MLRIHVDFSTQVVPFCLQEVCDTRAKKLFRDLSEHSFTGVEKQFVVQQLGTPQSPAVDALRLQPSDGKNYLTLKDFCLRYSLSENTVNDWKRRYKEGKRLHHSDKGGVKKLDPASIEKLKNTVLHLEEIHGNNSAKATLGIINNIYQDQLRSQGRVLHGDLVWSKNEGLE